MKKYSLSEAESKLVFASLSPQYQSKLADIATFDKFKSKIEININTFFKDMSDTTIDNQSKPLKDPSSAMENIKTLTNIKNIINQLINSLPKDQYITDNLLSLSALRGQISKNKNDQIKKVINTKDVIFGLKQITYGIPSVIKDQERLISPEIRIKSRNKLIEKLCNLYLDILEFSALTLVDKSHDKSPEDDISKFITQIFKILDQQINIKEIRSVINDIIKKKIRFQASKSMKKKIKKNNNNKNKVNDKPIRLTLVRSKLTEYKNRNNEE
jgi:hypothetical protein